VENMNIIPKFPDGNTNKCYDLQVGAYSTRDRALKVKRFIENKGFQGKVEPFGSVYRVLVPRVVAPNVYNSVVKLGMLGFKEIWIKE
jgi:cell division protein FtsN